MTAFDGRHMPLLNGATEWLNSEPLGPAGLRGHVVLINFWTFTCINWLRSEPYVRAWSQAYRGNGLIVIGTHTPEFSFEHELRSVRQAISDRGIDYPVALDNDYSVWRAFDNHYWPALYFVDTDGIIRDQHFGEGRYEQSERTIQRLLGMDGDLVAVEAAGVEAGADWSRLSSPETYLGYTRGERFVSPGGAALNEPRVYETPEFLRPNQWALRGKWTVGSENVRLAAGEGSITYRFDARDAHLVLSPGLHGEIPFLVRLDGDPPGRSHGLDIDEDGSGVLQSGRLYQLIRQKDSVGERTLEVTFLEPGAEAYVFTFG